MSKKHSNKQHVSAGAMTPEELVRRQNQEANEMLEEYNSVDGYFGPKAKSGKSILAAGVGLAGARLPSRPVRLSDEEPMTAAEIELLEGAIPSALSKLPDDFGYTVQPRYGSLSKGPAFVAASQHFLKKNGVVPSDTDRLLEKADALIAQMSKQSELTTMLLKHLTSSSMLANERIGAADVFHADYGDDK